MKQLLLVASLTLCVTGFAAPPAWQTLLREIVNINSSSGNPAGLQKVRNRLKREFTGLGLVGTETVVGPGHKVVAYRTKNATPVVALIGHVDTVFDPKSSFQKFVVEPTVLRGPGVNDMKGGIVMMLEVLRELKASNQLDKILVILNDDEEIGSPHSAPALKRLTASVPYGLVFEPTLTSAEHVTTTQAGVEWLELTVKGKAAHAGAEHEKGLNACVELAHELVDVAKLTDYQKKLTVNPGVISGGTKANVVCEEARATLDVRFVEEQDLVGFREKLLEIISTNHVHNKLLGQGPATTLKEVVHIPSLTSASTAELFQLASNVAKAQGFELKGEHMGGASDANQLAPTGMKLLGGLGPWGKGAHSENEVMDLASFGPRVKFNLALIQAILAK